ncbi:MAG: hypothetical protein ABTQ31_17295 [Rhizobiaceae bacterium]|mgnify:CR=1 FL=1
MSRTYPGKYILRAINGLQTAIAQGRIRAMEDHMEIDRRYRYGSDELRRSLHAERALRFDREYESMQRELDWLISKLAGARGLEPPEPIVVPAGSETEMGL